MKSILTISLLFFSGILKAQDSSKAVSTKDTIMQEIYDKTFTKVEIEAAYLGGDIAWKKFLAKNLRYPDDAINNEIQGIVFVQFIVDTEGNVSDIKAISGPTKGGLRDESIRLLKISGQWVPAIQNGRKVKSYKKVPFTFKIEISK